MVLRRVEKQIGVRAQDLTSSPAKLDFGGSEYEISSYFIQRFELHVRLGGGLCYREFDGSLAVPTLLREDGVISLGLLSAKQLKEFFDV